MHDFIQTSGNMYNYFIVILLLFIILVLLSIILVKIFNKNPIKEEIGEIMLNVMLIGVCTILIIIRGIYTEYTGEFKVIDSSAMYDIYNNHENSIIIQDKHKNERLLPVNNSKIYHKGDIVQVKIFAPKYFNYKPTLKEKIYDIDTNNFIGVHRQILESVKKVK